MKAGFFAKKVGTTQVFRDNVSFLVTVLELIPSVVLRKKTLAKERYTALVVGVDPISSLKYLNKPDAGFYEKNKFSPFRYLRELRTDQYDVLDVSSSLDYSLLEVGVKVDVKGRSKGKGFQGVMKRHNKKGGPKSHGSCFHRSTGSIGQRTYPGKVFKNMKLPGHMGDELTTVKSLRVVKVQKDLLYLHGSVPGAKGANVFISMH